MRDSISDLHIIICTYYETDLPIFSSLFDTETRRFACRLSCDLHELLYN
jgi:hypothetical protein